MDKKENITETTVESKTLHDDEDTEKYEKILEKREELNVFLEDGVKSFPIKKKSFLKIIEVMPKKKELSLNYVSFSATSTTEVEERIEMIKKQKSKAIEKEAFFKINIPKSHPLTLTFKPDNNEFDLFKEFFNVRENKKKLLPVNEEVNVPEEEKKPKLKEKSKVLKKKQEEKKPEEKKPEEKKPEEKKEPKEQGPKEQESKPTKLRGKKKDKAKDESKKEEPKKEEPKKEEKKPEEDKSTEEKQEDSKTKLRGAKKPKQGKKEDKKEDKKEEKEEEKKEDKKREDKSKGPSDSKPEYQLPVQYSEYVSNNKVQFAHHWRTHPRTYGKDSRYCRVCRNTHGLIRKYGLMMCRKCFRERYTLIGFTCTK